MIETLQSIPDETNWDLFLIPARRGSSHILDIRHKRLYELEDYYLKKLVASLTANGEMK